MSKSKPNLLEQIKQATDGLIYMSENQYPLKPFHLEVKGKTTITGKDILKATKHSTASPIEPFDFDNFFLNSTQEQDWHSPEEKKSVKQYQQLVRLLKKNLSDLQVFKVGKTEMDVYVVGKSESGEFLGLSTKVVET